MPRIFDINLLEEILGELGFDIADGYRDKKMTGSTQITGCCATEGCDGEFTTSFHSLADYRLPFCKTCKPKMMRIKRLATIKKKYNVNDVHEIPGVFAKQKKTMIDKYGAENDVYNLELLKKFANELDFELTKDYKPGELSAHQKIVGKCKTQNCSNEFSTKFYKFALRKLPFCKKCVRKIAYGRTLETFKEKYGTININALQPIKDKRFATNIKKYGSKNAMQNAVVADKQLKSSYKLKKYVLPSGKVLQVQGYEPFGLDKLIKEDNIDESDIITERENVPEIWYKDENNVKHRHYVDIFVKSLNKCIEIKSKWTIKKVEKDKIFLKQKAAQAIGLKYEIWVFSDKGKLAEVYS